MRRKKLVILPKLYDADGNIKESWFVEYSYRNPKSEKMQRFRIHKGFNKLETAKQRYIFGKKIIQELTTKLKLGWSPFTDQNDIVIYDDEIQYSNVLKVYGKARSSNTTLKVHLNGFLAQEKVRVSPKSFESYQSKIRLFSQWLEFEGMSNDDISVLNEEVILKFFDYLIFERKLQGRTIQKYGVNLRHLFNYLVKKKIILINPMPETPKVANKVDMSAKPIRQTDVELLKYHIQQHDPQLWLAIQFEFYCFIRPGNELRKMKIAWIDFFAGTITIPGYIQDGGENFGIAKNRKTQSIAIPIPFLDIITKVYHLNKYNKELYVFGPNHMPGTRYLGKNTLRVRFNKYRDALNLSKDYKFYSWKHTGGINASNAGIPIKDIQMQMRHSSLDITDKYLRKMKGVDSFHIKNNFPTL